MVLPIDLLQFEERYRPSIVRAFGSHVIAASSAGKSSCEWLPQLPWTAFAHNSSSLPAIDLVCPRWLQSAVADQLVTRFGIPSITLDGQVASKGTLQVRRAGRGCYFALYIAWRAAQSPCFCT